MQVTPGTLRALSQGFKSAFMRGIEAVQPTWPLVAMEVSSNTKLENYGWIKNIPGMREWVGDRVINNFEAAVYQLMNKDWENTVSVQRNDIDDDTLGIYTNTFSMQGEIAASHPDILTWQVLLAGFTTLGMDGQYFFDTDHVGYDANGAETSYSNTGGGAGAPWFLMDLSRSYMKPMIMQKRKPPTFVSMTAETDDNVFFKKEFVYGVDARYNVGFGFHQLAYVSKQALDATSYAAAKLAMGTQLRPDGTVLNVRPTHLITGPSNESAAKALLNKEYVGGGDNNIWYNDTKLIVIPALG